MRHVTHMLRRLLAGLLALATLLAAASAVAAPGHHDAFNFRHEAGAPNAAPAVAHATGNRAAQTAAAGTELAIIVPAIASTVPCPHPEHPEDRAVECCGYAACLTMHAGLPVTGIPAIIGPRPGDRLLPSTASHDGIETDPALRPPRPSV